MGRVPSVPEFLLVKTGTACRIVPALRTVREGQGTHFCGCAGEVKSLRHPSKIKSVGHPALDERVGLNSTSVVFPMGMCHSPVGSQNV